MERVIHFEIPTDNPEEAIAFYRNVFGWTFNAFEQIGYWMINTGKESEGIDGGMMQKRDPDQPVVNMIKVKNMVDTLEKIAANGGKVVVSPFPIPGVGEKAFFKDTDGHIFGIIQFEK